MDRIVIALLLPVFAAGIPALAADTGDGPDLGGKDKILKMSPVDLGFTNVPNWLKFPPAAHPDWQWDDTVAGVAVDSKDNVYVSHRGDRTPRPTVWKPDGSPQANWTHIGRVYTICEDKNGDYFISDGLIGRITKVRRDGSVIGFFEASGKESGIRGRLINAHSLAICSNGDLITGTYQGWVERWKAPGND